MCVERNWMRKEIRGEKKRKSKEGESEWATCHHVGRWEKMMLSSSSQSGGDMGQGDFSFLF